MPVTTLPDEPVLPIDPVDGRGAADREAAITERISAFAVAEHARVVAAVSLWSGSVDDASDAVVDALGRAWERLEKGKPIDNLAAWVTRVAMNQVRSRHRHLAVVGRRRHLFVVADHPDPSGAAADRLDVARALATLTERQTRGGRPALRPRPRRRRHRRPARHRRRHRQGHPPPDPHDPRRDDRHPGTRSPR